MHSLVVCYERSASTLERWPLHGTGLSRIKREIVSYMTREGWISLEIFSDDKILLFPAQPPFTVSQRDKNSK